jgi:H+/Cl- antiporter ClcA
MLFFLVLLVCLMLAPSVGITMAWKINTTPYRLLNTPSNTWPLIFILALGLLCILFGTVIMRCASALLFAGIVFGFELISAWYWDLFLSVMLV